MGMTFRYLFRSTAILARVVAILADHVASQAEQAAPRNPAASGDGRLLGGRTRSASERRR